MDNTRFLLACQTVMQQKRTGGGIGTLGEKTLHAVLKQYFDADPSHHEIPAGPYVADICNQAGFWEIQTRDLYRLQEKVEFLLQSAPVTVVFPVPAVKWLVWVEEDGSTSVPRKSPKRAGAYEILPELYAFRSMLCQNDLRFCAVLLELEEYRLKNGWSQDGKRGSTRYERFPIRLMDQVWLTEPADYKKLVPPELSDGFTAKEFAKAAGLSPRKAGAALRVLSISGAVYQTGKAGRAFLYSRA